MIDYISQTFEDKLLYRNDAVVYIDSTDHVDKKHIKQLYLCYG